MRCNVFLRMRERQKERKREIDIGRSREMKILLDTSAGKEPGRSDPGRFRNIRPLLAVRLRNRFRAELDYLIWDPH
jgi:hypothetical protein